MIGHGSDVFQRAAVFQIGGDAGSLETVVANRGGDPDSSAPAPHLGVPLAACQCS